MRQFDRKLLGGWADSLPKQEDVQLPTLRLTID